MTLYLFDSAYDLIARLRGPTANRGLILMYHRVTRVRSDPWSLAVSPANFEHHLQHLSQHFQVLALQRLVEMQKENRLPQQAVAITFDDGYADNLHNAQPLLARYGLPATFFISSGYLGQDREFWWDELDKYVHDSPKLPATLTLNICGKQIVWYLTEEDRATSPPSHRQPRARTRAIVVNSRHAFYQSLWKHLYPLAHQQRQAILEEIANWAGTSTIARESHRILSHEELVHFALQPLVTIGGHTVTHLSLPAHPTAMQWKEIRENKRHLERILKSSVTTFSYPHGDYTATTQQLLQSAGFEYACTVEEKTLWPHSNQYRLPRYQVGNWDQETFAKRLEQWFS